jgi:hypothetical protein
VKPLYTLRNILIRSVFKFLIKKVLLSTQCYEARCAMKHPPSHPKVIREALASLNPNKLRRRFFTSFRMTKEGAE